MESMQAKFSELKEQFKDETAAIGFGDLAPIAIGFVVIVIIIAVGAIVVSELRGGLDNTEINGTAYNVTGDGLNALSNLSSQTPLLATVIIFSVIIAVVVGFFAMGGGRRGGSGSL